MWYIFLEITHTHNLLYTLESVVSDQQKNILWKIPCMSRKAKLQVASQGRGTQMQDGGHDLPGLELEH